MVGILQAFRRKMSVLSSFEFGGRSAVGSVRSEVQSEVESAVHSEVGLAVESAVQSVVPLVSCRSIGSDSLPA